MKAMLRIHDDARLAQLGWRLLLQIHDELVFEVPESELESLVALVRHEVESALDLDVPLVVDCAAGHNWLEIEEISGD